MQELDITFGRATQIWWAWAWRTTLFGSMIGFFIGFVMGLIAKFLELRVGLQFILVEMSICIPVGLAVSIWVQAKVLKKKFSSFRIALIRD